MVSILLLTIDRSEVTKRVVSNNLRNAGTEDYELCIMDNGSKELEIKQFIATLLPNIFVQSRFNQGVAKGLNVLMKLAKGDYFFHMANDIELPLNWLKNLVHHYERVPNAGMVGIHCVETLHPVNKDGVHAGWNVFGSTMISRYVVETIGYYNEAYTPYGLEDSDYHYRLNKAGFINFYIPNATSHHIMQDVGEDSDYRRMKDESLKKNAYLFGKNITAYDARGNYYVSDDAIINMKQFWDEREEEIY